MRNVKPLWSRFGTYLGIALGGLDMWTNDLFGFSIFGTLRHGKPDHATLDPLPWARTDEVVITEKDAVKLRPESLQGCRIWVVALDFRPEPAFEEALLRELRRLLPHGPSTD